MNVGYHVSRATVCARFESKGELAFHKGNSEAIMSGTDKRISLLQDCICGSMCGISSRTLTAPLDVAKVLYQVGTPLAIHTHTNGGLLRLWKTMYIVEGWRSLFKGNKMACMKIFPYELVRFGAYHEIKSCLSDEHGRLTPMGALVTGALTGMTATVCTYPMDMLKTRMIVQPWKKKSSAYKNYRHAFSTIRSAEGWRALYRGLAPTLTATMPSAVSLFCTYELIRVYWYRPYLRQDASDAFLQGVLASVVSLCVSHPFDTIRRKMQAQSKVLPNNGGVNIKFIGAIDCYRTIVKQLRVQALWHGFFPAFLRIVPFNAIMFTVYEVCKRGCISYNGYMHRAAESHYTDQDIDDTDYFDDDVYHEKILIATDEDNEN